MKKAPGSVTQTGEAPDGEEWDYSEHGAYWDKDDPDSTDPYGEAQEFHNAESTILEIAQEVASEEEEKETKTNEEEDSEMDAALSMIKKSTKSKSRKPKKNSDDGEEKTKKKRRKVKRRKSN